MKKLFALLAVPALLLTTGCGNVCTRAEAVAESFDKKIEACPSYQNNQTETVAQCEADLEKCSSADQDLLNKSLDCQEKIPNCEAGKELEFLAELGKCAEGLSGLSEACKTAKAQD